MAIGKSYIDAAARAALGATSFGLVTLACAAGLSAAQATPEEAADAAEVVVQEAENAIRAIDPTTGGASLVVDPSLPQPYNREQLDYADLPELPPVGVPSVTPVAAPAPSIAPIYPELFNGLAYSQPQLPVAQPRGPASRTIERPQAHTPAPTPTVAPATAPAASGVQVSTPVVQPLPVAPPAPAASTTIAQSNDPFVIKSILPIEGTIRYGEWYWDESRAPATGKLVMTVDLDARVISVFRDGHEIGTAVALLGTQEHPTPLGTFPILTKEKDNVSEKYNNAPMPWTLRLTWSGIAIHGSPVANGYASHGCIGVPDPFAEKLFEIAKRGDKVIITRGQMVGVGDKLTS